MKKIITFIALLATLVVGQHCLAMRCTTPGKPNGTVSGQPGSFTLTCSNANHTHHTVYHNVRGCCWCGGPARIYPGTLAVQSYGNMPHCTCIVHAQGSVLPAICHHAHPLAIH